MCTYGYRPGKTDSAKAAAISFALTPMKNVPAKAAAVSVQNGVFYSYAKPLAIYLDGNYYLLVEPNSSQTTNRHYAKLHSALRDSVLPPNLFKVAKLPANHADLLNALTGTIARSVSLATEYFRLVHSKRKPLKNRYYAMQYFNETVQTIHELMDAHGVCPLVGGLAELPQTYAQSPQADVPLLAQFALEGYGQ